MPTLLKHRVRSELVILGLLLLCLTGCSVRTYPPIKYVPLLGKEKKITTTSVLARALKDRDVAVRAKAVELLGILSQSEKDKVKREVAQVLGLALKDRDAGIRLQVIEELGKVEEKYSNKYLLSALKDPNPFIREKVLQELLTRQKRTSELQAAAAQAAAELAAQAQNP